MKKISITLCMSLVLLMPKAGLAEPSDFESAVQPFLARYCVRCHNEKTQEGEFRLDTLARDFADENTAQLWAEVILRMNSGEMPPEDEPQPKTDELGRTVDFLAARITEGRAARMAKRDSVSHYRLSRDEYANTVYDLLGVHYDARRPGALIEDPRWHGFERIGSLLSLSPSHVERYMKAAEVVLDRAFPEQPVKPALRRVDANVKRDEWLEKLGVDSRVRWLMWPNRLLQGLTIYHPGTYRIRIQLSGLPSLDGRLPHLSIWDKARMRSVYDLDVNAPEDDPTTLDFELVLVPGKYGLLNEVSPALNRGTPFKMLSLAQSLDRGGSAFIHSRESRFTNPTGLKLFTDDGSAIHSTLIVDWFEWEGPLASESNLKKRVGFVPAAAMKSSKPPTEQAQVDAFLNEARRCLLKFAERAWRRPVTDAELNGYVGILKNELAAGEGFRSAYRAAMVGVLTSKNFIYIVEGSPQRRPSATATYKPSPLNDWELYKKVSTNNYDWKR
ncbi:MAG: DUF1587 domain-containing protein [Pirellulales bacterium]|nr:DUF1587 domain-containing protein [Pirellulales bacterium]